MVRISPNLVSESARRATGTHRLGLRAGTLMGRRCREGFGLSRLLLFLQMELQLSRLHRFHKVCHPLNC